MFSVAFLVTLRMKRLWVPGFSLALILLPGLGFAETQQFRRFLGAKQIALPELSDGLGWKQSMYCSTIQTADIDGDGQGEVLARWIDGLSIYRFENGTLLRHSRILALSDNAGFYEPSWYSTIHTAVLDRKLGQADVIARERDGIHVFRYDSTQHEWQIPLSKFLAGPRATSAMTGTASAQLTPVQHAYSGERDGPGPQIIFEICRCDGAATLAATMAAPTSTAAAGKRRGRQAE